MTDAIVEPPRWSRRRLLFLTGFVFCAQLAFIVLLSGRPSLRGRPSLPAPTLRLAGAAASEWLALSDQTLFALPHPKGFSGQAWLTIPPSPSRPFQWAEPVDSLLLPVRELGKDFDRFIATDTLVGPPRPVRATPQLALPEVPPLTASRGQSSWRVEGSLAQRRLLSRIELPAWPNTELLTNTVVQVLVDAEGKPISATLLGSGCGLPAADQFALQKIRAARFESRSQPGPRRVTDPLAQLTWGTMVFEWQTLPVTTTNNTGSVSPSP